MRHTLRAATALIATVGIIVSFAGCATLPEQGRPLIVVTTNILGDVVTEIVGDVAEVVTLMQPNADPHSFEISAQQAAALDHAALVVSSGLGLEEGLEQHVKRVERDGGNLFVAGEHVTAIPYASDTAAEALDPHFWTDPTQMVSVVAELEKTLLNLDGFDEKARSTVAARASDYSARLTALDSSIASRFAALPSEHRVLVTNHHVFGYFAQRYNFRILGTAIPGGTTLAAPSAADLRELVNAIEDTGVASIFAESSSPDRLMQVLASEADLEIEVVELFTESLTAPGGGAESYTEMLRTNADRIVTGLAA